MNDKKTESDLHAFVVWATRELWGIDEAPARLRAELLGKPTA